ncbi:MAG: sodium:alanine symporter family protein [bacterium]|nr:sodium:alanine symporter family protein [bacterium]
MELIKTIVSDWLWGLPLIIAILATGIFLTLVSGFYQFRYFGYAMRESVNKMLGRKQEGSQVDEEEKSLSPLEAVSVAVGTTVGVGNIAGVASAIATGGPGAVFWLWVAGFLGQIIKMAEVSLAVHYRSPDKEGATFGGPSYYIMKGIGLKRNNTAFYKILNFIFIGGFVVSFLMTMQNYTVSEAIAGTFAVDPITVGVVYTILTYIMISGGLKGLGRIAVKLVPFMCLFFLFGGIFIILKHISALPSAFGLIFEGAFNGTAVTGGFVGAGFAQVVRVGMARAIYSNEAGWGTSPMIHASARTDHPIKQGMMGVFEVFIDTIVVCSIVALTIIITGQWVSGESGATLTLSVFQSELGEIGRIILTGGIFLFGITTSTGFYVQIEVVLRYFIGDTKNKALILSLYKWSYPIPAMLLVVISMGYGLPTNQVWLFADMGTALPIFANVIALAVLFPDFRALLNDYKARHMGIGTIDPNFKIFYNS